MGTREAQIERIAIIDEDGRDVRRLEPGAAYRLRFEAVARSDQSTLSAGFLVRDRSGQTIFGLDTRLDRELGFAVRAGERFAVSMRILNHLGPGEYFLSFGIARLDGTKLDYCYDAVQFVVGRRQGVYHASRADLDGALAIERLGGDRGPSESRPVERAAPRVDDP
jgi:lipopolysaccharide transport system ATP-binding protein